jgi:hypothetical protein
MSITGLSFDGVVKVATASGPVRMLRFTMRSMILARGTSLPTEADGTNLSSGGSASRTLTKASSMGFAGHIVLYVTAISGDLKGVKVAYTPSHPPSMLKSDVTLTNVVVEQPFAYADTLAGGELLISAF